ncbi:unnamed protein product [Mytilus coruscus]|uniref:Uncharacterized protein n=1 Tax=Mytilus coruscus TaxID=42192 RepID=A0A6J8BX34_MYTCO|nr:unnamed protein product [Mytilus coruscus]
MTDSFLFSRPSCGTFCEYSQVKYPKFVPVEETKKSYKFPCSKIDKEAPKCWFDIQTWYTDYLDEKSFRKFGKKKLKTSLSDSAVGRKQSKGCEHLCELKQVYFDWTNRKSLITDKRFGTNNLKYLTTGSAYEQNESKLSVELYIKIMKQQLSTLRLCHMKTELIVQCLQLFFKPYDDTTVLWVTDLQTYTDKAKKSECKDIFNEPLTDNCTDMKAVLYLDKSAARLLRHKDMCVLDTLATIIEVRKDKIMILPMSIPCVSATDQTAV